MMRKTSVLITGAGGEIGHGLIEQLAREGTRADRHARPAAARARDRGRRSHREFTGSILDRALLERILAEFESRPGLPPGRAAVDPVASSRR